ncbi:hypothetical protein NA56DRAFT_701356 [Hyaloscypha hepaticicola]|uniref:Uncharacterized protein n=1 Tax=Hyaloscypha hepaticicola TaxID=2082293 RepID=A0A2J6QCF8_9HELO|nr:hypothetical protein NA56DRAFT_701356 [Hyaloscypha hepaticicola]
MRILIHQRPTPGAYHTLAWGADLENWQHIQTIGKEICSLPDVIPECALKSGSREKCSDQARRFMVNVLRRSEASMDRERGEVRAKERERERMLKQVELRSMKSSIEGRASLSCEGRLFPTNEKSLRPARDPSSPGLSVPLRLPILSKGSKISLKARGSGPFDGGAQRFMAAAADKEALERKPESRRSGSIDPSTKWVLRKQHSLWPQSIATPAKLASPRLWQSGGADLNGPDITEVRIFENAAFGISHCRAFLEGASAFFASVSCVEPATLINDRPSDSAAVAQAKRSCKSALGVCCICHVSSFSIGPAFARPKLCMPSYAGCWIRTLRHVGPTPIDAVETPSSSSHDRGTFVFVHTSLHYAAYRPASTTDL